MKQQQFEQQHSATWERYIETLQALQRGSKHDDLSADFVPLYRELCQHLALARDRHYTPTLQRRLNQLAIEGQTQLYGKRSIKFAQLVGFFAHDFPASVRREWRWMLTSSLLFFGLWIVAMIGVLISPELVYSIIDPYTLQNLNDMYGASRDLHAENRNTGTDIFMFGYYIWNNVGIGFRMLASFVMLGFGPIFMLIHQGVFFGATTAYMINQEYSTAFFSFTSGHSSWELIAIMFAGAVGTKLGWTLLAPGTFSRAKAIRHAVQEALPLIYGLFFMLLMAAAIEGFWSSTHTIPPVVRYCVGVTSWAWLISYFVLAGRTTKWFIPAIIGSILLSGLILWFRAIEPSNWLGFAVPVVLAGGGWLIALLGFSPRRKSPHVANASRHVAEPAVSA